MISQSRPSSSNSVQSSKESDSWEIHSNSRQDTVAAVGIAAVGAVFMALTRSRVHDLNMQYAYWLGILLLALGGAGLILQEKVSVLIFPSRRKLRVRSQNVFGQNMRTLEFIEVKQVRVVKLRAPRSKAPVYLLKMDLRNGQTLGTGRWSFSQTEIDELATRLASSIDCPSELGPGPFPATATHVALAGAGAVLFYIAWYRMTTGQLCPAMWFGSAPPVIMLVSFVILLGTFRRLFRER